MIAEASFKLIVLLAALTLLGAVMGYCVALLVTKRKLQSVISAERARLQQENNARQSDLQMAQGSIASHRTLDEPSISASALAQAQAKRIRKLEARLRELQVAEPNPETHTDSFNPPTLSRRANSQQSVRGISTAKCKDSVQSLSQDLIIPTLAESGVTDSDDDLELDLFAENDSRATPRG